MLLLIVTTGLTLPLILNSDSIKQKIQRAVAETDQWPGYLSDDRIFLFSPTGC